MLLLSFGLVLLLNTDEDLLIKHKMAKKKEASVQSSFEGNPIPRAPLKM